MLSSLSNPLLPLAFASAVLIAQLWVLIAAGGAKGAFEAFVTSVPFQARVTRSSGLEGPCVALFLTAPEGPPSRGAALLELGLLPQPTPHQRWWGLVPNAHLEMVDSIDNMMGARSWLWTFIVFTMLINMLQLAGAVFATSAMDPQRMIKIYLGLSTAGLNTIVNSAVLCSMFGIYYDVELGLPLVNYVPGWAYLNVFMIMVATVTMIRSGHPAALLAAGVLGFYLFFWIVLPFIFGYTWNFSWAFVDAVVGQESASGGGIQTGFTLPMGQPLVIHSHAVEGLATPFSFAVWTGVATFLFGVVGTATSVRA